MKIVTLVSLGLACTLFTAGCGDDTSGTDAATQQDLSGSAQDLTVGGQPDLTMMSTVDMAYTPSTDGGPFMCGNAGACGAQGKVCCVTQSGASCETACADGGLPVQCSGPEFCGGDPCCATVTNGTPTSVLCTDMPKACVPNFDVQTRSGMTRVCHADPDCTAGGITTNYPDCCTAGQTKICFNKMFAAFTNGQITCP